MGCFYQKGMLAGILFTGMTFLASAVNAAELTGAGASFPAPLYAKWSADYKNASQIAVNYQSIGSGGGIRQIEAKTVDFGASDMPLSAAELDQHNLMQFPTVIGGVVPIINIPGMEAGRLKLTGPVMAGIFSGKITNWNDDAIKKINPDIQLPDLPITVVHRADSSGTSFLFTTYLSDVDSDWKAKTGAGTTVSWPVGFGSKGNEGVAAYVQRIKGAIGYVEYAYAFQNKMIYTLMENQAGKFVSPGIESFKAAAKSTDWDKKPSFDVILVNQMDEGAWPISGATFILIYKTQDSAQTGQEILKFFDWAYKNGAPAAESLYYVPLPESLVSKIQDSWKNSVKDAKGQALWPIASQ
ncbi:phosphate ABC transporter substrate-binding protein PstS [Legionella sp. CNM-4043-24]|uniref:phosphate ABC transporter substrate-binding protein PstS n=1 Tax=Legionella sp. CNM-4043-24 TaxID=3421646 RepID=UPI00403AA690